jgi:YihY family inner membrane protein
MESSIAYASRLSNAATYNAPHYRNLFATPIAMTHNRRKHGNKPGAKARTAIAQRADGPTPQVKSVSPIDISINRDTGVRRAIYVMNSGIFNKKPRDLPAKPVIAQPSASLPARLHKLASLAVTRIWKDGLLEIVASLSFTTILALVPLLAVAFWVFSLSAHFTRLELELIEATARFLPNASAKAVAKQITEFAASAAGLGKAGLVGLVVTSVLLFMSIENAFDRVWANTAKRPLVTRLRNYLFLLLVGPLALGVGFAATSALLSLSQDAVAGVPVQVPFADRVLWNSISVIAHGLGFAALYYALPRAAVRARHALVGGMLAAIAFEVAKRLFAWYVLQFPEGTLVYGAFAALPTFLLWVYICWLVTVLGALGVALWPHTSKAA